jgi:SAM-dependent methyltransferase
VIVDARLGIGVCGPPVLATALARAIGLQLAWRLSPPSHWLSAEEQWAADLPHGAGRQLRRGLIIEAGLAGSSDAVAVVAVAAQASNLPGSCRIVVEIGAGYGRTCHAVLANYDVAAYYIVDLDNSLDLARAYLREVLGDDDFAKVRFVPAGDLDAALGDLRFDLCLNVDSFAEMDGDVVHNYLAFIAARCRNFYVKNPVGKYLDPSLDGHAEGPELVAMALRTGLLRDVIDVHDSEAVRAQSFKFLEAYRPAAGWATVDAGWAPPWSYYWQALYRTDG